MLYGLSVVMLHEVLWSARYKTPTGIGDLDLISRQPGLPRHIVVGADVMACDGSENEFVPAGSADRADQRRVTRSS